MTLWEIWSYGDMPYGDLNGQQVLKMLEEGGRLAQPRKCPDVVYKVSDRRDKRPRHEFCFNALLSPRCCAFSSASSLSMSLVELNRLCVAAGNLRSTTDHPSDSCSSNSPT